MSVGADNKSKDFERATSTQAISEFASEGTAQCELKAKEPAIEDF
jgi:hypothetical protein